MTNPAHCGAVFVESQSHGLSDSSHVHTFLLGWQVSHLGTTLQPMVTRGLSGHPAGAVNSVRGGGCAGRETALWETVNDFWAPSVQQGILCLVCQLVSLMDPWDQDPCKDVVF